MNRLFQKLYYNRILSGLIHTTVYCLRKELQDCESVLDLGCGQSSPLQYCTNIKYSVGVEAFKPYLDETKKNQIHNKYLNNMIEELDFAENSFDAVIMIEVIEHLPKDLGDKMMEKIEKWAKKKIIVMTPNGLFPMGSVDNNNFQKHLSGWNVFDLKSRGFKCYGMAGAKFMHKKENNFDSMSCEDVVYSNIKYNPKKIFYIINALFQIFMYYLPEQAFELFAVKYTNK
jgi:SAM-dependent methyltransferase